MNTSRRQFLQTSFLWTTGLLTGCITSKLYEENRYSETVSSILVTEDRKKIVIMTSKYHYIFDAPDVIANTLSSTFHKSVSAQLGTFNVDTFRKTSGKYKLVVDENASDEDKQQAIAAGYRQNSNGLIIAEGSISGIRYDANNIQPKSDAQLLNYTYQVNVNAEQSLAEKSAKSLATPVTLTLDGILIIGAIPLMVFSVGVLAAACNNDGCK